MSHSIGNRLLPDAKQRVADAQRNLLHFAPHRHLNRNRPILHDRLRSLLQSRRQSHLLHAAGAHCGDVSPRLGVPRSHHVYCRFQLLVHRAVRLDLAGERFQLESQSGKTLRQGVVHLHCQPFPLFHYCAQPRPFYRSVGQLNSERKRQQAENQPNHMRRIPPRRRFYHLRIFDGTHEQRKGHLILCIRSIGNADAAQAQAASYFELVECFSHAGKFRNRHKGLVSLIEFQHLGIAADPLFRYKPSFCLNELRIESPSGSLSGSNRDRRNRSMRP